ncbi:MAG TPA: hypothetical protein PLV59_01195 [Candidatus Dojkabacteria bacterium]|nr:hypothetical protein [Candidatus Dojkabacteria bacterium]
MDFLEGLNTIQIGSQSLGGVFKLLFMVVIFGYIVYTLLLTIRVRILNDTVKSSSNKKTLMLSYIHLLVAIVGSLFCVILILVG